MYKILYVSVNVVEKPICRFTHQSNNKKFAQTEVNELFI